MGGSSAREIDMEGMDRFGRAIEEEMKMNKRRIVGVLIHKGDA
jgi:hypothetical protein